MDNREDDNRPEDEATPADTDSDNDVERGEPPLDSEESDPAMPDQLDLEASSSADGMQADTDADTEDDATPKDEEPGKDWLVDTGLAAAINPESEAAGQASDDDDEDSDSDSSCDEDCDVTWDERRTTNWVTSRMSDPRFSAAMDQLLRQGRDRDSPEYYY